MKKLIFLLLMAMALVGMVSAMDTAHPPGGLPRNLFWLNTPSSRALLPSQQLVSAMPAMAELSSFQAVMVYNALAIQPQNSGAIPITDIEFMAVAAVEETHEETYYMRL